MVDSIQRRMLALWFHAVEKARTSLEIYGMKINFRRRRRKGNEKTESGRSGEGGGGGGGNSFFWRANEWHCFPSVRNSLALFLNVTQLFEHLTLFSNGRYYAVAGENRVDRARPQIKNLFSYVSPCRAWIELRRAPRCKRINPAKIVFFAGKQLSLSLSLSLLTLLLAIASGSSRNRENVNDYINLR